MTPIAGASFNKHEQVFAKYDVAGEGKCFDLQALENDTKYAAPVGHVPCL